jgi:hypothetical protein
MKLIRNAFAFGAVAVAALAACSSQHGSTGPGTGSNGGSTAVIANAGGGDTGTVKMHLMVAPGDFLYSLSYTCTGPSVIPPGMVSFNDAQSIEYVLGGIAAGSGYQCTLTGTDSNGDPCSGTTTQFTVSAGQVSGAGVNITCTVPSDASTAADVNTGSVGFDAAVTVVNQGAFACPGITAFSIVPSEIIGSQPAQLTVNETGPIGLAADGGATTSDVIWTATCATPPCGSFSPSTTASNPTFTCGPNAEQVTIQAQVTNFETSISTGVTSDVCAGKPFTTMQATIQCEGGGTIQCFAPTPNICGSGATATCHNFQTENNNCGGCGITCSGATPDCIAGICSAPPPGGPCTQLVGGVPADASGNTTCVQCDQNTNKICTPTEAVIVQRDQIKGLTSSTLPSSGSCYECAVTNGFIDSTVQAFTGNECGDLTGAAVQQCLDALNCYSGSPQTGTAGATGTRNLGATAASVAADCTNESPAGVFNCFCGTNEPDVTDCKNGGTVAANVSGGLGVASPNGACISQIIAGTGTTTATLNATIITDMGNTTLGAGLAAQLMQNAGSNISTPSCSQCFK